MNHEAIVRTQQLKKKRRIKTRLKRVFLVLACVVVFCTTYALILPAITTSTETFCGFEEHFHTAECYEQISREAPVLVCDPLTLGVHVHGPECWNEENLIICGLPDFVAHSHDDRCFGEDGLLICTLPERTTHVHTDECYRVVPCETETSEASSVHIHSEACYATVGEELVCTVPEDEGHTHGEGCYVIGETLLCTESDPEHIHEDSCYELLLRCTVEEAAGHTHGEECYAPLTELVCTLEETSEQTDRYEVPQEYELICGEIQAQVHVHDDQCFREAPQVLTCTLEEDAYHSHTELCYGLWELCCEQEEHTHDIACYADFQADLEQAADWESSFADVELRGIWQQDVLAIARTQLGYQESTNNYVVAESGVQKGYTRYGAWYGDPYGDWCAMFVSFCMHYGGVEGIPLHSGCTPWIRELREMNLFREQGTYRPEAGDIIFFDWEGDGLSDHVGLVSEWKEASDEGPAELIALEGNASNRVRYVSYDPKDTRIAGYGQLSRNRLVHTYCGLDEHTHDEACYDESGSLLCALVAHSHDESCNSCKVVYYDNHLKAFAYIQGAPELPEDLSLKVTPLLREDDPQTYDSMSVALSEKMACRTEYVGESAFYSLRLFSRGEPYDLPEGASVSVEMSFHRPVFTAEQLENTNGVHTYIITPDPEAGAEESVPVDPTEETVEPTELHGHEDGREDAPSGITNESVDSPKRQPVAVDDGSGETAESAESETEEQIPVYEAQPAEAERLVDAESGITGVSFRTGEIATVAFALTRQTVTGTFWERVSSTDQITADDTYMIISVEGNYALRGNNSSNYTAVTVQTVKANEEYYVISDSDDTNLLWTIRNPSSSNYTIQNQGSSSYVYLNNSWFGSDTVISSSSRNLKLTYQTLEKCWRIAYSSNYLTNSGSGAYDVETSGSNEADVLIFRLAKEVQSLEVPADYSDNSSSGSDYEGDFEMPVYPDLVEPSDSKQGETSLTGEVDNGSVTIQGEYFSDPATSDIERQYQVDTFAEHEHNDGKVLSDKSVIYMDDDYDAFGEYAPNTFGVTLSAMAQEYKVPFEYIVKTPIDVVFVLDVSGSMATDSSSTDSDDGDRNSNRLKDMVKATNASMKQIFDDHDANRVGIAIYSGGAWELLPLGRYTATDNEYLVAEYNEGVSHPEEGGSHNIWYAVGSDSLKSEDGTTSYAGVGSSAVQGFGTYTQAGISVGQDIFEAIGDDTTWTGPIGEGEYQREITVKRQPVIILVSDGEPTYSTNIYMDPMSGPHYGNGNGDGSTNAKGIHGYYTVLTANYAKRMVSLQYEREALFYTVGMYIYAEGDPNKPENYSSKTDDNYKIAVLNPDKDFVENLEGQTDGNNISTTTDLFKELILSQHTGQTVTVSEGWEEGQLGIPHIAVPVLQGNPYDSNYSYTDAAYFGQITEEELKVIFEDILKDSQQYTPYGFILYNNSAIDLRDNIGVGMEIKGAPVLRYNGVNYTHTSTSVVGAVTTYVYDYIHNDPYIPKHEADLSQVTVKIVLNDDGTQSVILYVPDSILPTYTPVLETDPPQDYYEMLPIRLTYQVGLTEASKARVLDLQKTGGELIFYANKWGSLDEYAMSTLVPADNNPYYIDVDPDDGILPGHQEHQDVKTENTTGTFGLAVDCHKYVDTDMDNRTRIVHTLGNNGKLVFRADTTEIPVEKQWEDANADIMNPVTLGLYRVAETVTEEGNVNRTGTLVAQKQLDINNQWKDVFGGITLPDGDWYYVIVENHVTGYQAFYNGELVTFSVDNTPLTGVRVDFTQLETEPVRVTNAPTNELPPTGGAGTILYTMGGCFLIAAAALALLYTKQGKGRRGVRHIPEQ